MSQPACPHGYSNADYCPRCQDESDGAASRAATAKVAVGDSIDLAGTGIDADSRSQGCKIIDGSPTMIRIYNQGGYDFTEMNVEALLAWLKENRPEFLKRNGLEIAPPRGGCGRRFHHSDCDCGGVGGDR